MKEIKSKIIGYELVVESTQDRTEKEERVVVTDVKLPEDALARMKTLNAEGKKWYLTVVYHPNSEDPFALFCTTNHKEKSAPISDAVGRLISLAKRKGILEEHVDKLSDKISNDNNINKLTRTISLLLRHKVAVKSIVSELDKMEDVFVGSFLFQIKKFLSQYILNGEKVEGAVCSECNSSNMVYSEGCMTCADCGNSKCG